MAAGSGRDGRGDGAPPADWATREPLPQWQHLDDGSEDDRRYMGSTVGHLTVVGLGWAAIVGGSIAHSVLDPSKRHLLLSHRLIHARLTAQWCGSSRPSRPSLPPPTHTRHIAALEEVPTLTRGLQLACRATVGALMLAGIGEHFASRGSMLPSMPRLGGAPEQEAPAAALPAQKPSPKGEDWTRL